MTIETKTDAPKKLTITLTARPPVKITGNDWPIVAEAKWSDHDGQVECEANRHWTAWIKVRQHTDGRTIVYGRYSYSTAWQGEANADYRDGQMLTIGEGSGARPVAHEIVAAIESVGARLAERSGYECWTDIIADTIANLPAEELT